eukprot:356397-Chlamydomonas_euryale.AAC.3
MQPTKPQTQKNQTRYGCTARPDWQGSGTTGDWLDMLRTATCGTRGVLRLCVVASPSPGLSNEGCCRSSNVECRLHGLSSEGCSQTSNVECRPCGLSSGRQNDLLPLGCPRHDHARGVPPAQLLLEFKLAERQLAATWHRTASASRTSEKVRRGAVAAQPKTRNLQPRLPSSRSGPCRQSSTQLMQDAGSPGTDAGSAGTDAGSPGTDAGSAGTDAGSAGTDAGSCAEAGLRRRGCSGGVASRRGCGGGVASRQGCGGGVASRQGCGGGVASALAIDWRAGRRGCCGPGNELTSWTAGLLQSWRWTGELDAGVAAVLAMDRRAGWRGCGGPGDALASWTAGLRQSWRWTGKLDVGRPLDATSQQYLQHWGLGVDQRTAAGPQMQQYLPNNLLITRKRV